MYQALLGLLMGRTLLLWKLFRTTNRRNMTSFRTYIALCIFECTCRWIVPVTTPITLSRTVRMIDYYMLTAVWVLLEVTFPGLKLVNRCRCNISCDLWLWSVLINNILAAISILWAISNSFLKSNVNSERRWRCILSSLIPHTIRSPIISSRLARYSQYSEAT